MLRAFKYRFSAMTVPCEVIIYEASSEDANKLAQFIFQRTKELENAYNFHASNSWLTKKVNERGKESKIKLNKEATALFDKVYKLSRATGGLFGITIGTLKAESKDFPTLCLEELNEECKLAMGLECWELCNNQLVLHHPNTQIDLGGVVKEFAVDEAAKIASTAKGGSLINFGGDMVVNGRKPNGELIKVGIRHPQNKEEVLLALTIENAALTSSGNYERYLTFAGVEHNHIIGVDVPRHSFVATSVIAADALTAGVYSTVLMLKPDFVVPDHIQKILIDDLGDIYTDVPTESCN